MVKSPIKKIILHSLSEKEEELAHSIKKISTEFQFEPHWIFALNNMQAAENLSRHTLLVSNSADIGSIHKIMFEKGSVYFLTWQEFKNSFLSVFKLITMTSQPKILLAFLPPFVNSLLEEIFSLYGYSTLSVNSFADMQKALAEDICYTVLNQDMNLLPKEYGKPSIKREKVIQLLKQKKSMESSFAISVLKDFDQGSLFDDICSSVKHVCNLLLSIEEYVIFIIQYLKNLSQENIESFYYPQKISENVYSSLKLKNKSLKNFSHPLKDAKEIYRFTMQTLISSKAIHVNDNIDLYLQEMELLKTKNLLTSWLPSFLNEGAEKKNRASFSFINGSFDSVDKLIKLNEKEKPVNKLINNSNFNITPQKNKFNHLE
ncbi:MAG: hypothetical protein OEZ22_01825 [Spirochaetia bacterium]|nr:hypothetical protein [Spirochaetia bacterium]